MYNWYNDPILHTYEKTPSSTFIIGFYWSHTFLSIGFYDLGKIFYGGIDNDLTPSYYFNNRTINCESSLPGLKKQMH